MLLLKTAFKNIIGNGKRTWLNVTVLSVIFVIIIAYNGLLDGWTEQALRETRIWETGEGQIWQPEYDRYDMLSLLDAHGIPPKSLHPYIENKSLSPVLVLQASIYPQQRLQNILLKGIDPDQKILALPTQYLAHNENEIPIIIGKRAAKSAKLKEGDRVMLRWRDNKGAFDATEVVVANIFDAKTSTVDNGQIWINLYDLYKMTSMNNEATYLVASDQFPAQTNTGDWQYKDLNFLMSDIYEMINGDVVQSYLIYAILLAMALLSIFDTQTLSIFRRQKEIGTYVAMGMTPKEVTRLFTIEGTTFSLLAMIATGTIGSVFLYWFSKVGFSLPESYDETGIPIGSVIYPTYKITSIVIYAIIIIVLSAIISYMPARKIAKQNVVLALKGKSL